MPEKHAILSPSSAHRWMECPGSVVLEESEPNIETEYAREGSIAHALGAHCLEKGVDTKGIMFVSFQGKDEIVPSDMRDYIQIYVSKMRDKSEGHELLVEQPLEIEPITGEKDAIGTGDAITVYNTEDTLGVDDLKYGMGVKVFAKENKQMMIYGASAVRQFDMIKDFKKVKLAIHQPRLNHYDEWEISVEDLNKFVIEVGKAVLRIEEARKSNSLDGFLNPGEEQCKFCKAKAKCPAIRQMTSKETGVDFDDLDQTELPMPTDLSKAMLKVDLIEDWIKAIRAKVESELFSGRTVSGFKLVEGRKGKRSWADEKKAEEVMKGMRFTQDEMYDFNILSPAEMEKKLKSQPKRWAKLSDLIVQKNGKPSVVQESDPRPALDINPENDFANISES